MNNLEETRKKLGMTQVEAAKALNISRRTYQKYENEESLMANYDFLIKELSKYFVLDEEHGYLSVKKIKDVVREVAPKYPFIHAIILFGSYARNEAYPDSDIDLLLIDDVMGLNGAAFYKEMKEKLVKDIDFISYRQVQDPEFLKRIFLEGIKIYEHK